MTLISNVEHKLERWSTQQEAAADLMKSKSPDAPTSEPLQKQKHSNYGSMIIDSSTSVKLSSLDILLLEVIQRMTHNSDFIQEVLPTQDSECLIGKTSGTQPTNSDSNPHLITADPGLNIGG